MRYCFGDCILDTQRYELWRAGQRVLLRRKAFQVLAYLLTHRDRVVSKDELLAHGWPEQYRSEETLSTCIAAVRRAVSDDGAQQAVIQTRRGYGYRFVAAVEEDTAVPHTGTAGPLAPIQTDPRSAPAADTGAVHEACAVEQTPPPAARRPLTVLFCDLVDSTRLAERFDPEDLRAMLQAYLKTCTAVVTRWGGTIDQFLGDGVLVCFGYPQAHDDDPQRAVRAGLEIVDAMAQMNTHLAQTWGVQLAVRIGMHTGLVVAGALPVGETSIPRAIVGEAPNIAARLQERAAPNTVVCSAATARLVDGYFTLEALGPQRLKGVTIPVPVYRVVAASATQTRFALAMARGLTPLVGREQEIALLQERWAAAIDGRGQVVVLSGEAGIGKSRLVQAVTTQLTGTASTLITYYCSPYYQQSALYPVIDSLHRLLQWRPDDTPVELLRRLEAALMPSALPLDEAVPLLAALLELPLPARYPPLTLTPQRQKQQTLATLLAWLLREAERQPVCVVLEDLHWADPSTLEWLSLLLAQIPTARVLLLLLFRPEFRPPWAMHSYCTYLALGRLSTHQTAEMVQQVIGDTSLPPAVIRQVVATTDGVPLFIEELTKMVVESALVDASEGRYALRGPLAIPATLHDSLLARLDRLGPASQIAHWGAVLGREFLYEVLQAVVPVDEAVLMQGLAQLVEAELLYQRGVPPQVQYRFKHALIQEAAYRSLLTSTRQQYHQHIAQVLETRFPHIAATQPELLAQHYAAAGHSAHAVRYWQRAGERNNARSAYQEAIVHLTQGLNALQQLPETAERLQQELGLRMALGPALMAAKGYAAPEVQAAYAQAQELCRRVPESPQLFPVLFGLWGFYLVRAEYPSAQARAHQLLHIAEEVQEPGLLVEAHGAMGVTAFYMGHLTTSQAHLAHSLACYDPMHHRQHALLYGQDPWVACRAWEGQVLWLLGYPDQALQHSREALAYAQELAHPFSIVFALYSLALVHQLRRESAACQEHAARQLHLSEEQGFPFWVGPGAILLGWALAEQGHVAEGVQRVSDGLAVRQAMGAGQPRPYYAALLAQVYEHVGKVQEALALLRGALQGATDLGEQWCEAELYRLQGELLLQALEAERGTQGRAQAVAPVSRAAHEAEGSFHKAIALAQQQGAKAWELRATLSLSQLWARQGRQAEARQLLGTMHSTLPHEGMETADRQAASTFLTQWA